LLKPERKFGVLRIIVPDIENASPPVPEMTRSFSLSGQNPGLGQQTAKHLWIISAGNRILVCGPEQLHAERT
jgi:hypothetical protein